jgi:hypothetical protein
MEDAQEDQQADDAKGHEGQCEQRCHQQGRMIIDPVEHRDCLRGRVMADNIGAAGLPWQRSVQ